MPAPSFPGRKPQRGTSWLVRLTDLLAQVFITVGGIGTIVAVTLVCVFLIWVVRAPVPGASVSGEQHLTEGGALVREQPVREGVDEYQTMGWSLFPDGTVATFRLDDGRLLDRAKPEGLYKSADLSAWSAPDHVENLAWVSPMAAPS